MPNIKIIRHLVLKKNFKRLTLLMGSALPDFSEKIITYTETYWRDANKYQILREKNAPKEGISANIELFLIFT